jgi:hypothetical protein
MCTCRVVYILFMRGYTHIITYWWVYIELVRSSVLDRGGWCVYWVCVDVNCQYIVIYRYVHPLYIGVNILQYIYIYAYVIYR